MLGVWAVAAAGHYWKSQDLFLGLMFVAARSQQQALVRAQVAGATTFHAHIVSMVAAPIPGMSAMEAVPVMDPSWEDMI